MTTYQILSLCALVVAVAGVYGSALVSKIKLPKRQPSVLSAIESIVAVRQQYSEPEVQDACNALLAAILKVRA